MEYFAQQLINGVTLGSIYGLIAIGYTMVFGIIGMVNFAHGDLFMLATFIVLIFLMLLLPVVGTSALAVVFALVLSLAFAMVLAGLWNWAIERIAYRPLRGSFRLAPLISAIGMSIFLSNFVQVAQGPNNKSTAGLVTGGLCIVGKRSEGCWLESSSGFGVTLPYKSIVIMLVTALLLAAFWYVVQRTPLGRAQRACEQDQTMARLIGIDVDWTISMTFVMGAALAAVAGGMYLLQVGIIGFADGFVPGVKAFTAAVLGGIGSLPGAVIGGLLLGIIESLWSGYRAVEWKDVAAFSILAIVLIFRPSGLLGRPDVEKV